MFKPAHHLFVRLRSPAISGAHRSHIQTVFLEVRLEMATQCCFSIRQRVIDLL